MSISDKLEVKSARGRSLLERACDAYEDGDLTAAIPLFQRAARLGNPHAQVNLGNLYDDGEGVHKSFPSAVHYYRLAVKNGLPEGAYNLAIAYRNRGNKRWAQFWFRRASEMGDVDAALELERARRSSAKDNRRDLS